MAKLFPVLGLCLLGFPDPVETLFLQVQPEPKSGMEKTAERAVLLVHGIRLHPFNSTKVAEARLHSWQRPDSPLVKALGKHADVYSFAYGQNVGLEQIASTPALGKAVAKLKFMGYRDIVLVGHSAGGLLARLFVEDFPESGVTAVVQVCAPNEGSTWAKANFSTAKEQDAFLQSLTRKERTKSCEQRAAKKIPPSLQFVCVVGVAGAYGDGMVSASSQWPADLQKQGIPAVRLNTTHVTVLRAAKTAEKIAQLVCDRHPRWSEEQVKAARKGILVSPGITPK